MAAPLFACVLNTLKTPVTLSNGQGNSVNVNPTLVAPAKISYEYTTWAPMPKGVSIVGYVLENGSKVKTYDPSQDTNNQNINSELVTPVVVSPPSNTQNSSD